MDAGIVQKEQVGSGGVTPIKLLQIGEEIKTPLAPREPEAPVPRAHVEKAKDGLFAIDPWRRDLSLLPPLLILTPQFGHQGQVAFIFFEARASG